MYTSVLFDTDYVQVVDMGTLELRITAVKPGLDGKLVGVFNIISQKQQSHICTLFLTLVFLMTVWAKIWAALLKWRHSHQNMFGLLCCPHEPDPVYSQLWRFAAPCRTWSQAQQHYTKKQGDITNTTFKIQLQNLYWLYILSLSVYLDRRSFPAGPHLRPHCLLRLSSRCCRIWWVKPWRRLMGSMHQGCNRMVKIWFSKNSIFNSVNDK